MQMYKLVFIFGLFAVIVTNAKLTRMSIHREENFMKTVRNVNAEKTHILNKHNMDMDESTSCYEEMESFNLLYYGYISVGSPPQNIKVLFDTATQNLYIAENAFNATASRSYLTVKQTLQYHDVMKLGTTYNVKNVGSDIVQVSNLTISDQIFGLTAKPFNETSYQGLLGLGSTGLNVDSTNVDPSVLDNMYRQGLITQRVFSFYMVANATFNEPSFGGEIIFGGSDASLYSGDLNYVNITFYKNRNSAFRVENISVGGKILGSGFEAVADTGTDLIGCSVLDYALINAKLNGYVDEDGNYFVNCSDIETFPNIIFNINMNISVTLTPQDYIVNVMGVNSTILCMSAISFTTENYWILGTTFLSKFYLEFDYEHQRIGFATPQPTIPTSTKPILPLPTNPLPKKICKRA